MVFTGHVNHTPGQAPCSGRVGPHKMDSVFIKQEKETEVDWLGKRVIGRSWGREKYDKIH